MFEHVNQIALESSLKMMNPADLDYSIIGVIAISVPPRRRPIVKAPAKMLITHYVLFHWQQWCANQEPVVTSIRSDSPFKTTLFVEFKCFIWKKFSLSLKHLLHHWCGQMLETHLFIEYSKMNIHFPFQNCLNFFKIRKDIKKWNIL